MHDDEIERDSFDQVITGKHVVNNCVAEEDDESCLIVRQVAAQIQALPADLNSEEVKAKLEDPENFEDGYRQKSPYGRTP